MEKTVQNLLQCLQNVICGEDVPLIAMSETEQEKFYQMSLASGYGTFDLSKQLERVRTISYQRSIGRDFGSGKIWQSIGIRVRSWHWKRFELFLSSRRFFSFL